MEGYPYTWFKSLGTPRAVEEKLDRVLANEAWMQLFPHVRLENLAAPSSDHFPILLDKTPVVRPTRVKRTFKFENAWRIEDGVNEVVKDSWQSSCGSDVIHKLSVCAEDLSHWSKNHCNKFHIDIEVFRKELNQSRGIGGIQDEL